MPKYAYKAIDSGGKQSRGIIEAENEAAALKELGRQGLFVEEVHKANITEELREDFLHRVESERQRRERIERQRHEDVRKRRQRLVIRYRDGRTEYGVCFALNPKEASFHLDKVDQNEVSTGESKQIRFSDLKAVFFVKSFDGKYDKSFRYKEWTPMGGEVVVEFLDGEVIRGACVHHYDPNEPRFHLVPTEEDTNNISILVEATAITGVFSPEEYQQHRIKVHEERRKETGGATLTQEETMGDFYFETRNYESALEQYEKALKEFPQSGRLRKKALYTKYNIGVSLIKRRDYVKALAYMEEVLKHDPRNERVRKKEHQLRKIVEKMERAKSEHLRPR